MAHNFTESYTDENVSRIAFPLGGLGAGMLCVEGTGALSHVSLRHAPEVFWEPPGVFAAVSVVGRPDLARVAEGQVPDWKKFGPPNSGNGSPGATYGLPRFESATFTARFPFGYIELSESDHPLELRLTGWSPFTPPNPDPSSLPVAAVEYEIENTSDSSLDVVFSFNANNFMATRGGTVRKTPGGFILSQSPTRESLADEGYFAAVVPEAADASVNASWFRGSWFDALTMAWKAVEEAQVISSDPPSVGDPSPGASLFVPVSLSPGQSETIRLLFSWYVPRSNLSSGKGTDDCCTNGSCADGSCDCSSGGSCDCNIPVYEPWYATQFAGIEGVLQYWKDSYEDLRSQTTLFTETFFESTMPQEFLEAVSANLSILKSPTILRQVDGRMWMWEGCHDSSGCCSGSCTHVWNYAQAAAHLFPSLEQGLRQTEYGESLSSDGHQVFRATLPIRDSVHDSIAAADGQLGSIMRVYREWRISGDTDWLRSLWSEVKQCLDFCVRTWDPDRRGVLEEPHHNTYDIEFWGADAMCTGFYLGALRAAELMGRALGEQTDEYEELYSKGQAQMETDLFNGEYFYQKTQWTGLKTTLPVAGSGVLLGTGLSIEEQALAEAEGPKYQYGTGCLSDQLLGDWLARMCGIGPVVDPTKAESAVTAVFTHNFRESLRRHANAQRPTYALGDDGGLLNCSWPTGGRPTLPFVYSDEVWTGIEYQVASHLYALGRTDEARTIVATVRRRYDGRFRNPFNEYECGHWYGRALASYGLLVAHLRYDAVRKSVIITRKDDFTTFLSTATGFGLAGIRGGKPFVDVRFGQIEVEEFVFE